MENYDDHCTRMARYGAYCYQHAKQFTKPYEPTKTNDKPVGYFCASRVSKQALQRRRKS